MPQHQRISQYSAPAKKPTRISLFSQVLRILVLLLIAAIILSALLLPYGTSPLEQKINSTKTSLGNVKEALKSFRTDCGHYPTTAEGLDALVHAPTDLAGWHPVLDKMPTDRWGNPFRYVGPGPGRPDFDLYSIGPDGIDGTADDIHLRDLE